MSNFFKGLVKKLKEICIPITRPINDMLNKKKKQKLQYYYPALAQMVERLPEEEVAGSIPAGRTMRMI